jgi:hypothetical protein
MRRRAFAALLLVLLAGCYREPHVALRVRNTGTSGISQVELDYGRAFGIGELKPGEARERSVYFPDSEQLTLAYFDAAGKGHSQSGPKIAAQDEGSVEVQISDAGVTWKTDLRHH